MRLLGTPCCVWERQVCPLQRAGGRKENTMSTQAPGGLDFEAWDE